MVRSNRGRDWWHFPISAPLSKNAVSANIKQSRYFHLTSKFWVIHFCGKRLHIHMFEMGDTALSYKRALIVCHFLQEPSKVKESRLLVIRNADTAFLLGGTYLGLSNGHWHFFLSSKLVFEFDSWAVCVICSQKRSTTSQEQFCSQSKNAVSAFQITYKLLSFTLEDSWEKKLVDDQYSSII